MEFIKLAEKRKSCRTFLNTPVDHEVIEYCLEAARLAPSAKNSQPWHFIVVNEEPYISQTISAIKGGVMSFNKFVDTCGAFAILVQEKSALDTIAGAVFKQNFDFADFDDGIAAAHFCLAAAEKDLGTCILGMFNEKELKQIFKIQKHKMIRVVIALGNYKETSASGKKRKPLDEIASYNTY